MVSPDSEARDRATKPRKYAETGIKYFWLVEMAGQDDHPVVYTHELNEAVGYYTATDIHHERVTAKVPYDIDIDLTTLDRL